jgi:hypothetical protein
MVDDINTNKTHTSDASPHTHTSTKLWFLAVFGFLKL